MGCDRNKVELGECFDISIGLRRGHDADGVAVAEAVRSQFAAELHHFGDELERTAGAVLGPDTDEESLAFRRFDDTGELAQHPLSVAAELDVDQDIGDGDGEVDGLDAALQGGFEVLHAGTVPGHHPCVEPQGQKLFDVFVLARSHGGNADFQLVGAAGDQALGYGQLLLGVEGNVGCLFAVSERRVVYQCHAAPCAFRAAAL